MGHHKQKGLHQMAAMNRRDIRPGIEVDIILKKDQRTGKLTRGIVKDILTKSTDHPHGIKVRLSDGQVGRVKKVLTDPGSVSTIRQCTHRDFETIYSIINEAAQVYKGVIPGDRWKVPYMSKEELKHEIDAGVVFWGFEENDRLIGVMGIQHVRDVTLIRHAYVRWQKQQKGVGKELLMELCKKSDRPILIGTWADATWAIRFYEKHGFKQVSEQEKRRLLEKYWSIPARQVVTSVVLADRNWFDSTIKGKSRQK
jgi:uncharacterized repeat protein (TIGR03833 family)